MPAAPAAPPSAPAGVPPGVTIVGEKPPAPPPPPKGEIKVSQLSPGTTPEAPAKPGTAKDKMFEALRKRSKPADAPAQPDRPGAPDATQDHEPPEDGATPPGGAEPPPEGGEKPAGEEAPPAAGTPATEKGKRANPWKLVEEYKGKIGELEKQVLESKGKGLADQEKQQYETQLGELRTQLEGLQNELRFVNYQQSDEFKAKYQAPYENAWKRTMQELSEIPLTDPASGEKRAATPDDMLALVNMPALQAREAATQLFGEFADDVMAYRREIKKLNEDMAQAIADNKKNGAEREKQTHQQRQAQAEKMGTEIKEHWQRANEDAVKHEKYGRFFKPIDGDQDGNQRLAKGFELVDRAFGANPADPNLTPEQRAAVVRVHAAVRNRAAAFGRLVSMVEKLEAERDSIAEELKKYKDSTPPAGDDSGGTPPPAGAHSARESVFGALRKLAK